MAEEHHTLNLGGGGERIISEQLRVVRNGGGAVARLGGRLRKQRQVQHARELRRKLTGTVSSNHHGAVRRGELRQVSLCLQRIQKPTLLGAGESGTLSAGGAGTALSLRVVIFQQALRPLRQHLRKTTRGGQRRIKTNVQVHRANRLGRLLAPMLGATTGQRVQARRKSLSLLALHLLGVGGQISFSTHKRIEETRLAGRLIHAATAQTLRAVRAQHRQGHTGVIRLHDGGHILAQCRTGGAHQTHGLTGCLGNTQGGKGCTSLVHAHVRNEGAGFSGGGNSVRKRCAAGSRRHDNMPHTGTNQRIEHGYCGEHGGG